MRPACSMEISSPSRPTQTCLPMNSGGTAECCTRREMVASRRTRRLISTARSLRNSGGAALREFIQEYYHPARPHQGLAGETPIPQAPPAEGELISVPVLGGLHHRYYRTAA